MRRLGTILMILGINLAIGSAAAAFYLASFECAIEETMGRCTEGAVILFLRLMGSSGGVVFWLVIVAGLLVFRWGKRMRAAAPE